MIMVEFAFFWVAVIAILCVAVCFVDLIVSLRRFISKFR